MKDRHSSVGVTTSNEMEGQGSIPGKGKIIFSIPQRPTAW
jgi:hypothetical protein